MSKQICALLTIVAASVGLGACSSAAAPAVVDSAVASSAASARTTNGSFCDQFMAAFLAQNKRLADAGGNSVQTEQEWLDSLRPIRAAGTPSQQASLDAMIASAEAFVQSNGQPTGEKGLAAIQAQANLLTGCKGASTP